MRIPQTQRLIPRLFFGLAMLGIVLMVLFAIESTPTGVVALNVDRDQAATIARDFVVQRGGDVVDRTSTVSFSFNGNAQSYLREISRDQLQQRAEADLNLATWTVRFWRQLDPDEWRVLISPRTGRILGYTHIIRDEDPAPSLSLDAAQSQAIAALPVPATQLELVERASQTQPARVDHSFTWQRTDISDNEAHYRYSVTVRGNQIGAVSEYYWLPESWNREGSWHAYRGSLLATIGWALTSVLVVLTGLTWLILAQQGRLRWRWAIRLLIVSAVVGLVVLLNSIPLDLANYDTSQSLIVYFTGLLRNYGLQIVSVAGTIVLGGMAGEALVWQYTNGAVAMRETVTKRGLVSRPVVQALGIGFLVGLFQLGFISAFYALGGRWFGIWSPVSVLYDDILSTPFPAIYAIALGLLPSIGEELMFRLGGITVLTRWTNKPKLAIVLTAIVWASLHTTYSQRPFFIRMLELSIIGIIFGVLFVRYGVLASMAAHYTYNASLMLPVFWGGSWFLVFTGILAAGAALLLLVPAMLRGVRGIPLEPDAVLADPLPESLPEPPLVVETPTWRRDWRWLGLGGLAALLALLVVGWRFAPALPRTATRSALIDQSRQVARQLNVDLTGLHPSVSAVADWVDLDLRYLYDELEPSAIQAAVDQGHPRAWRVRWNAWSNTDQSWSVDFGPNNEVLSFQRYLADDLPATTIPVSDAQQLAQGVVAQFTTINDYTLIDSAAAQLPARSDYTFTWQSTAPLAGEAYRRIDVVVQGDQVAALIPSLYTPPAYRRDREQTTTWENIVAMIDGSWVGIPLFLLPMLGLFGVIRRKIAIMPWVWLGVAIGIIGSIQNIGRWTHATVQQIPALFQASAWVLDGGVTLGGQMALVGAGVATALALNKTPVVFPNLRAATTWREALALGWLLVPWGLLFVSLRAGLNYKPGLFASPDSLNAQSALLDVLFRGVWSVTQTTLLLVGTYAALRFVLAGRSSLALLLTCAGFLLATISLSEPTQWILAALALAPIYWLARGLRNSVGAFALWWALLVIRLLTAAVALLNTPPRSTQVNGVVLLAVLGLSLGWSIGTWIQQQRTTA